MNYHEKHYFDLFFVVATQRWILRHIDWSIFRVVEGEESWLAFLNSMLIIVPP